ncbi:5-formyltetrahydrofolate cyclo-ligase [Cognatiluteimonas telluris]|jgi:5-formyltetrahydrofolate cyclo-ligase|uniref:5-formyltetrahydrofolate cyclo-ligase n=1 Tax=Cognatiluteimonas telluris TaxID=1104775 RepID=UPI00140E2963|nr:5-formyltetrahydrofolate cyclo-ligase [Lysobacter telluris]
MGNERAQWRRELRRRRRSIPASVRIAAAQSLAARLLALPFAPTAGAVAGYWAMDGEIALHAWQLALPPGLTYCLPVLCEDALLRFAPWRPGEPLAGNRHGIPEPKVAPSALLEGAQLSLVVVPLVGFDAGCQRLGMGGGWYDRTFAAHTTPPWLVGAAFASQQVERLPIEPWDVALDAVCTERDSLIRTEAPA